MKIEMLNIKTVKPYERNAKKHPQDQVDQIAHSIAEFGFQQPLVVDKDNVLIIGHGRLLAAKRLGYHEVPCIRAEDLSDEQVKALRLADNRVGESEWDDDLLKIELESLDFNMSDLGFLDDPIEEEEEEDDLPPSCTHNVFENQERRQFPITNYYGIPDIRATQTTGEKFLRWCDYASVGNRSEYICHFFFDDFKFIGVWRDPDKAMKRLQKFKAVVSPNFSLYTDFPRSLQILSCYRRNWCGAYWQMHGIDVIPNVCWGDKESYNYCFDGIPKRSTVAVSTVGVKADKSWNNKEGDMFKAGYEEMMKRLEPTTVLFYGDMIDGVGGNIIRIPSFYEQKRMILNEKSKEKKRKWEQAQVH